MSRPHWRLFWLLVLSLFEYGILTLLSTITSLTLRIKTDISQLLAGNLTLGKGLLRGSNATGGDPQEVVRLVVINVLEESMEPA